MRRLFQIAAALVLTASFASAQPVGDVQFLSDGAVTIGKADVTTGTDRFVSGDVGKWMDCGPSTYSGVIASAKIKAVPNAKTATLEANATKTGSGLLCQWGTDDTAAINTLLQTKRGGRVELGYGCFLTGNFNATLRAGMDIYGQGNPVNNVTDLCHGTVLIAKGGTGVWIDTSGSAGFSMNNLQMGTTLSPVVATTCLFIAPATVSGSTVYATKHRYNNVFCAGAFQIARYIYGTQALVFRDSDFVTYYPNALFDYVARDNLYGITSPNVTTATGYIGASLYDDNVERHAMIIGGGSTAGGGRYRGVSNYLNVYGLIDSSSYNGTMTYEASADGVQNFRHTHIMATIYNEQSPQAVYCINIPSGTFTSLTYLNVSCTASSGWRGGSGKVSYEGLETP